MTVLLPPALAVALAACGCAGGKPAGTGDLPAIRERGVLRILTPPLVAERLARRGFTVESDIEVARKFAATLGLESEIVEVPGRADMLEDLLDGRGDLVVAGLTITEGRAGRYDFSLPIDHVREMLVSRAEDWAVTDVSDLEGRSVAVRASSSYFETLDRLKEDVPGIRVQLVPENLDTEQIIDGVARGEFDTTIADDDVVDAVLTYRDDVRPAFPVSGEMAIGWAMRPESPVLKQALDRFLQEQKLIGHLPERLFGDLDAIRERKVLRVLTRNNAVTYFIHRGRQVGFEFELAERFAKSLGCRLKIIVPPEANLLIPWLEEGRADLIAADLSVTPERRERVAFSRPYNRVREMLVAGSGDELPAAPEDLAGRTIVVRESSAYHETLKALEEDLGFTIEPAPESTETDDLIARVGEGEDGVLTLADDNILDIELAARDDVRGAFPLGDPRDIAWAARPGDTALLGAVNEFLVRETRSGLINVLKQKYFGRRRRVGRVAGQMLRRRGEISPFDALFRRYSEEQGFDWRLVAAQAYQESGFQTDTQSFAGAIGLMQILPETALEVGVSGDLTDPENSIIAGTRYLRRLRDRFDAGLAPEERDRFALAAYNVGTGHVLDGRRLARELGLDADVWFSNVEKSLALLSQSRYARNARYGYCRCGEPVRYVREISERYAAYVRVLE